MTTRGQTRLVAQAPLRLGSLEGSLPENTIAMRRRIRRAAATSTAHRSAASMSSRYSAVWAAAILIVFMSLYFSRGEVDVFPRYYSATTNLTSPKPTRASGSSGSGFRVEFLRSGRSKRDCRVSAKLIVGDRNAAHRCRWRLSAPLTAEADKRNIRANRPRTASPRIAAIHDAKGRAARSVADVRHIEKRTLETEKLIFRLAGRD
jgi:hypothetical protein